MFGNVNKELLLMKSHYFLYNAATAPVVQFLPTIAKQLGFTGFLVGAMYTILPICGLIAKPLFGVLGDKFHLRKVFFLTFQAILAVAFFTIYFIPTLPDHAINVPLICDNYVPVLKMCLPSDPQQKIIELIEPIKTRPMCNISCEVPKENYTTLCNDWKAPGFCALGNNSVSRKMTDFAARLAVSNPEEYCADAELKNISYPGSTGLIHPNCKSYMRLNCSISCPMEPTMKELLKAIDTSNFQVSTYQFHWFVCAAIIGWVGMSVVVSIADAICIDMLGEDQGNRYGKQKMWGSIGFGILGIGSGPLVDYLSNGNSDKDYSSIFYILLIIMLVDMIVSLRLEKKSIENRETDPSVLWELEAVAREGRVLVFAFWCIGAGMCTGVVWNFLFWHTENMVPDDQKDRMKTLQGLLTGVQCFLGELPFNFASGWVLKKFGHINVMSLVLLIYAVRFMAYSIITNPWYFLIVEMLHGPTLGLSWPTMVAYGDKIAPSGTRATMQGFVGGVFEGLGVSFGSLICGKLMDTYGGQTTFRAFSVGALVWLTVYWILQILLRKAKAYPIHQGHSHLATYATPSDAILMTTSQELQTY